MVSIISFDILCSCESGYALKRRYYLGFGYHFVCYLHCAYLGAAGGLDNNALTDLKRVARGGKVVYLTRFSEVDSDNLYLYRIALLAVDEPQVQDESFIQSARYRVTIQF